MGIRIWLDKFKMARALKRGGYIYRLYGNREKAAFDVRRRLGVEKAPAPKGDTKYAPIREMGYKTGVKHRECDISNQGKHIPTSGIYKLMGCMFRALYHTSGTNSGH